jgi:carbonic anhydrase/acetyltransferase-like protein (isoleucine patch superfamily)
VFVAPFARLEAGVRASERICVEDGADLQDNTTVRPRGGPVRIGEEAIVAHGAMLLGAGREVSIAHRSACPLPALGRDPATRTTPAARGRQALANALAEAGERNVDCRRVPAFMSFNALNRSVIEDGATLSALSRLARGVVLRAGFVSQPGKSLDTQRQADDPALGDVRYVTAADVLFMRAVLEVNQCLARGYAAMARRDPTSVRGINLDPGAYHRCEFNRTSEAPRIGGRRLRDPRPRRNVRIIGRVTITDIRDISSGTAIRADEGDPMRMGARIRWLRGSTFHALERSFEHEEVGVTLGDRVRIGRHVVVHGGGRRTAAGAPLDEPTTIEDASVVGELSVVFRSFLAPRTRVGARSAVIGYESRTPGEVIPARCVKLQGTPRGACAYRVEW